MKFASALYGFLAGHRRHRQAAIRVAACSAHHARGRARHGADLVGGCAAAVRAGDGLFVVDRHRRGQPVLGNQSTYFLVRHSIFLGMAWWLVRWLSGADANLAEAAPWLFIVGVVLLIVVLIPGLGREVNGAAAGCRWASSTSSRPSS